MCAVRRPAPCGSFIFGINLVDVTPCTRFRRTASQVAVRHRSESLEERKLRRAASAGEEIPSVYAWFAYDVDLYAGIFSLGLRTLQNLA